MKTSVLKIQVAGEEFIMEIDGKIVSQYEEGGEMKPYLVKDNFTYMVMFFLNFGYKVEVIRPE